MELKLQKDWTPEIKKGTPVTVDAIRQDSQCASGFKVKVRGPWKNYRWLDLGWVIKIDYPVRRPAPAELKER